MAYRALNAAQPFFTQGKPAIFDRSVPTFDVHQAGDAGMLLAVPKEAPCKGVMLRAKADRIVGSLRQYAAPPAGRSSTAHGFGRTVTPVSWVFTLRLKMFSSGYSA